MCIYVFQVLQPRVLEFRRYMNPWIRIDYENGINRLSCMERGHLNPYRVNKLNINFFTAGHCNLGVCQTKDPVKWWLHVSTHQINEKCKVNYTLWASVETTCKDRQAVRSRHYSLFLNWFSYAIPYINGYVHVGHVCRAPFIGLARAGFNYAYLAFLTLPTDAHTHMYTRLEKHAFTHRNSQSDACNNIHRQAHAHTTHTYIYTHTQTQILPHKRPSPHTRTHERMYTRTRCVRFTFREPGLFVEAFIVVYSRSLPVLCWGYPLWRCVYMYVFWESSIWTV